MLKTEMRNPNTMNIDKMDTASMLKMISDENYNAVRAVENALPQVAKAVDMISEALANGGRLIYIGAGTSGRLAVTPLTGRPLSLSSMMPVDVPMIIIITPGLSMPSAAMGV